MQKETKEKEILNTEKVTHIPRNAQIEMCVITAVMYRF